MPFDAHLTTNLVWACTGLLAGVDILLAALTSRMVDRQRFQSLGRLLVIASGLFYFIVWLNVMSWGWDWFYAYIFPAPARYLLPPLFGLGYALLALGMQRLSLKLPFAPALAWCALGGLEGLLTHIFAIYGLGAASKPPVMQGTDPLAVLIFAIFEKAFYWSLILFACILIWKASQRRLKLQPEGDY